MCQNKPSFFKLSFISVLFELQHSLNSVLSQFHHDYNLISVLLQFQHNWLSFIPTLSQHLSSQFPHFTIFHLSFVLGFVVFLSQFQQNQYNIISVLIQFQHKQLIPILSQFYLNSFSASFTFLLSFPNSSHFISVSCSVLLHFYLSMVSAPSWFLCSQSVVKMQSKCNENVAKMQPKLRQNAAKIKSKCSQKSVKILI